MPIKENDHAMDDIRYFVSTVLSERSDDFLLWQRSAVDLFQYGAADIENTNNR